MDTDSCIIRGGTVVCADRVLPDCDVVVIDGRIAAIEPVGASDFDAQPDATMGVLPVVDARGAYVAPGLIDIHSDYVENVASPRPSVVMDLSTSLYKADRELVSHGVTTIDENVVAKIAGMAAREVPGEIGRASCRERV